MFLSHKLFRSIVQQLIWESDFLFAIDSLWPSATSNYNSLENLLRELSVIEYLVERQLVTIRALSIRRVALDGEQFRRRRLLTRTVSNVRERKRRRSAGARLYRYYLANR